MAKRLCSILLTYGNILFLFLLDFFPFFFSVEKRKLFYLFFLVMCIGSSQVWENSLDGVGAFKDVLVSRTPTYLSV